jgi:tetratricopeptide (TPR) repeat protein
MFKPSKSCAYLKRYLARSFLVGAMALTGLSPTNSREAGDLREIPGYPTRIEDYDAREIALLPRYCIYTQLYRERVPGGADPAEVARWYAIQDRTFHHMHHYCWGLMRTNRALFLVRTKEGREHYLEKSILDFDYVIERAPSTFILLPEILTKKGENLIRLGRGPLAISSLQRAIELKRDYWPAYIALSDYYKDQGDLKKARELLEGALLHSPDTKPVQKRLIGLGGLPPKPNNKQ